MYMLELTRERSRFMSRFDLCGCIYASAFRPLAAEIAATLDNLSGLSADVVLHFNTTGGLGIKFATTCEGEGAWREVCCAGVNPSIRTQTSAGGTPLLAHPPAHSPFPPLHPTRTPSC